MPRFSNRITKKRKFCGNQYIVKEDESKSVSDNSLPCEEISNDASPRPVPDETQPLPSASFTKLQDYCFHYSGNGDCLDQSGFRLIDLEILKNMVEQFCVCPGCRCKSMSISDNLEERKGWASNLYLICSKCQFSHSFYTSKKVETRFESNTRLCYAMRSIGKSHKAATLFSAVMNMPPPPANFQRYNVDLHKASSEVCETSLQFAGKKIKELSENNLDTSITVDGTWMRRGHTSLFGVVTANSIETGKVIDVYTCSKYCHSCEINSKMPKNSEAYKLWKETHKDQCKINYEGSSGGMEVEGALNIFSRSQEKHGLRYTQYIGDGDSKAHSAVVEAKVYGEDCIVEKHECIGHIQKRMGGRLRKLRKNMKKMKLSDGKPLSGKNRLTDKQIDSLQFYYGEAIRNNSQSVEAMKKAVWATFFHKASTDDNPQHALCPKGTESWCPYNKGIATGNQEAYKHKNTLPPAVLDVIKPIYRDLADPNLLKRCLHGKTQNTNEALNQLIWDRCPKTKFCSKEVVEMSAYEAVSYYNDGYVTVKEILQKLGITAGSWCEEALQKFDFQRIRDSDRRTNKETKKKRKLRRSLKKQKVDIQQEQYGYGMF